MPCEVLLVLVDIEEDVDDVRVIGHLCHFGEILAVLLKEGGMLDEQREEVVFNDGVAHLLALHPDICNEVCFRPFFLLTIDPQAVSQFFVEGADVSDVRLEVCILALLEEEVLALDKVLVSGELPLGIKFLDEFLRFGVLPLPEEDSQLVEVDDVPLLLGHFEVVLEALVEHPKDLVRVLYLLPLPEEQHVVINYPLHVLVADLPQHLLVDFVDTLPELSLAVPLGIVPKETHCCQIIAVPSLDQGPLELPQELKAFLELPALKHHEGVVEEQLLPLGADDQLFEGGDDFAAEGPIEAGGHKVDDVLLLLLLHQVALLEQAQHQLGRLGVVEGPEMGLGQEQLEGGIVLEGVDVGDGLLELAPVVKGVGVQQLQAGVAGGLPEVLLRCLLGPAQLYRGKDVALLEIQVVGLLLQQFLRKVVYCVVIAHLNRVRKAL